jgi:quercetin dioxygenase-like cupin family protein
MITTTTIRVEPKHQFTYDGAQLNVYHVNKGEGLPIHEHIYAHATMCASGSCLVKLDGRSYTIDKYSKPLNLPAGEWHEIEALEDNTVFINVFSESKNV